LIPENWYMHSWRKIMQAKGASGVLPYHNGVAQALLDLFPDLNWDRSMLRRSRHANEENSSQSRT